MKSFAFIFAIFVFVLAGCSNNDDLKFIEGSGNIEATNVVVSSKVSGTINKINFDEGTFVHTGDTVLIVDHELLDIQLKQAIAGKDLAEAQLQLTLKGARSEDISQSEEMLNQVEANYNLAKTDKERMKNLFDSQSITRKQWDDVQTRFIVAEAQYNAAKENVQKMKNISRPEEKKQAVANYDRAEAAVQLIEKSLRDCYVTAPSNGYIVKTFFETGESVMPGASLFKLSDLSEVDLVIYVAEEKLAMVKLGQKAEIEIDAFENKVFEGTVTYISPEAEFTPKNIQTKDERTKLVFAVKLSINNPDFELKAGLPADGRIIIN